MANRKVLFLDESTGNRGQASADDDVLLCSGISRSSEGTLTINPGGASGTVSVSQGNLSVSGNGTFTGSVQTGDLHLKSKDGKSHWTLREGRKALFAYNRKTGQRFKLVLEPLTPTKKRRVS